MQELRMSDVRCVVCGEPWSYFGIDNGDMLKWEAKLFHQGAGCPCCEGEAPEKPWEPESIHDVEYGDLDPAIRLNQLEDVAEGKKPKWERPAEQLNWECSGCGARSVTEPDQEETVWRTAGSLAAIWYVSHSERRLGDPREPAHKFSDDIVVCEACHLECYECGGDISHTVEWGDIYDGGWCMQSYDGEYYCVDCMPGGDDDDVSSHESDSPA